MRSYLPIAFGTALAAAVTVQASAGDPISVNAQLAQNTGSVDRTLGNGSMGTGEGIERLPEQSEKDPDVREQRPQRAYEQSNHGDMDTDMEHRPRRTLGDRDQD
mgnify:CR=1 FL=1